MKPATLHNLLTITRAAVDPAFTLRVAPMFDGGACDYIYDPI